MSTYIATIEKDPNSDYGVKFYDFPGSFSAGSTLEEVREMAQEALAAHIEWMRSENDPIPEPSSLDAVRAHDDHKSGLLYLAIEVPDHDVFVKLSITLRESLLKKLDARVKELGITRSGLIDKAVRAELASAG